MRHDIFARSFLLNWSGAPIFLSRYFLCLYIFRSDPNNTLATKSPTDTPRPFPTKRSFHHIPHRWRWPISALTAHRHIVLASKKKHKQIVCAPKTKHSFDLCAHWHQPALAETGRKMDPAPASVSVPATISPDPSMIAAAAATTMTTLAELKAELSGVMVVIIVAGGVLLSIVLFIFAKRQIIRFTIRSRHGPHAPVGHDAKKVILSLLCAPIHRLNPHPSASSPSCARSNAASTAYRASCTSRS